LTHFSLKMTKKLFVGNLSFNTREASLAAAFAAIGPVSECKIIAHGTKSLGYGFVDMTNDDDAVKAVEALNKKDLDGRQINVEIAKEVPNEKTPREPKPKREPRARQPKEPKAPGAPSPAPAAVPAGAPPSPDAAGAKKSRPRRRKPAGEKTPKLQRTKNPSDRTLFVANLPFQFSDDELKAFFAEFNPTSAHVVRKPNGNSRGYGFVDFAGEADQQKALVAMDKKLVMEREISVKVAETEPVAVERERKQAAEGSFFSTALITPTATV
jgi:RNA recognition motif-containing protein